MNNIEEDILNQSDNILTGTEAIEGAHIVIVDDARTFDVQTIVDEIKSQRLNKKDKSYEV